MTTYYLAVTYDVCVHNDLCERMSEYRLDSSKAIEKQVEEVAAKDIAPLVKVYVSETEDFEGLVLFKEYLFQEYDCHCLSS